MLAIVVKLGRQQCKHKGDITDQPHPARVLYIFHDAMAIVPTLSPANTVKSTLDMSFLPKNDCCLYYTSRPQLPAYYTIHTYPHVLLVKYVTPFT